MEVFRELYFDGLEHNVTKLMQHIERCLGDGWARDYTRELDSRENGMPKTYCFTCTKSGQREAATLWIVPLHDDTWYVSNVVPSMIGQLSRAAYNHIVEEFATKYAIPNATHHNVSVKLTEPTKLLAEWLSPRAEEALKRFSRAANKSTGSSHPLDKERWFRFLVLAHADNVSLDASTLQRWLVSEEGWSEDRASDLMLEYQQARALLEYYEQGGPWT